MRFLLVEFVLHCIEVFKCQRISALALTPRANARTYSSERERQVCYQDFIDHYNQRRPHTALNGASPISRVTKQPG